MHNRGSSADSFSKRFTLNRVNLATELFQLAEAKSCSTKLFRLSVIFLTDERKVFEHKITLATRNHTLPLSEWTVKVDTSKCVCHLLSWLPVKVKDGLADKSLSPRESWGVGRVGLVSRRKEGERCVSKGKSTGDAMHSAWRNGLTRILGPLCPGLAYKY